MANKRISELDSSTGLSSGDLMVVVDADTGSTQKATISQAFDYVVDAISVGSAAGDVLTADGAGNVFWSVPAPPSPAEPFDSIQFNDAGSFGGSSGLRWVADQIRVGGDDAGFLGNDAVFFAASVLSPPQYAGNEVGLGYSSSVGGSPATYLKLGPTGDTGILQLQGPLGTSPGLSLRYTNNEYPVEKPLWIDADGGPIRIGNNSAAYLTTKVILGSSSTSVRVSDAFDLPTADGAAGDVLTTDGAGNVSWAASGGGGTITGSGTATQIAYFTGASAIGSETAVGSDSFTWDATNNRLGVRTASPAAVVDIAAGTLSTESALRVTATSSGSVNFFGASVDVTGGNTGLQDTAFIGTVSGATAVSYSTVGVVGQNSSTQTLNSYFTNAGGPIGVRGASRGVNGSGVQTGSSIHGNVGVLGFADGSVVNVGTAGVAAHPENNHSNIGVVGTAANTGSGTAVAVGGLFTVSTATGSPDPSYGDSAALIADNQDTTFPIFLARDAGTTTFSIGNNGVVLAKNTADSTTAFQVQNAAGTTVLDVDTTTGRVGIGTATPAYAIDAIGSIYATDTAPYVWSQTTSAANQAQVGVQAPGGIYLQMRAAGGTFAGTFLGSSDANWTAINPNNLAGNGLKIGVSFPGSQLLLGSYEPGTSNSAVRLTLNNDEAIFNEPGHDFDFRVESQTNPYMLFVDASANIVSIGTVAPGATVTSVGYPFNTVAEGSSNAALAAWTFGNASPSTAAKMAMERARGTAASPSSLIAGDVIGEIVFNGFTNQRVAAAQILGYAATGWGASGSDAPGNLWFMTSTDGSATPAQRFAINAGVEAVVNDPGNNFDFRVGGTTDANALVVDASANAVGFGTAAPVAKIDLASGQLAIPDGTAAAPAVAFRDDLNTGLFSPANDVVGIAVNGTEVARFNQSGAGSTPVLLMGTTSVIGAITVDSSDPTGTAGVGMIAHANAGTAIQESFKGGQFAGLRTRGTKASPTQVSTDDGLLNMIGVGYTATGGYNYGALVTFKAEQSYTSTASGGRIEFHTTTNGTSGSSFLGGSTTERMRITNAGFIGIATPSPTAHLSVAEKFQVDSSGNVLKINNITTSWPAIQGSSNSVLTNDGYGNLSWEQVPGTGLQAESDTSGTITLDFSQSLPTFRTYTISTGVGSITFASAAGTLDGGRSVSVKILNSSGGATSLAFPVSWKFLGSAAPGSIANGKSAVLSIAAYGTADSDVVATYAVEP